MVLDANEGLLMALCNYSDCPHCSDLEIRTQGELFNLRRREGVARWREGKAEHTEGMRPVTTHDEQRFAACVAESSPKKSE